LSVTVSPSRAPASTTGRTPGWVVLGVFALLAVLLTVVVTIGQSIQGPSLSYLDGPSWLDGWSEGDSGWYYDIANHGYFYTPGQQSSIAFFPSYPLAVRALGEVIGGDFQIAGSALGVLSGAASAVMFAFWVWRRLPRAGAVTAIAVLLLYPYAFFLYGAMYSDSFFMLTALGAFVLLERRYYWLAGAVGALATAGRPVGVAVAVGLVVRMLEMRAEAKANSLHSGTGQPADPAAGAPTTATSQTVTSPTTSPSAAPPAAVPQVDSPAVDASPVAASSAVTARPGWRDVLAAAGKVRWREAGVLVSGLGLAAWCIYLWVRFGDPVAFATVQGAPGWYQRGGPHTWFKVVYVGTVLFGPYDVALRLTAQALMCLFAVLLLPRVQRLFGWGYLAYCVVVLAIPIIGTKDFMGTGRYVLAAFPVIAAAGDFLATRRQRWVRPVALGLLGLGLVAATAAFSMGVAVS
jgi:hypothetical protein